MSPRPPICGTAGELVGPMLLLRVDSEGGTTLQALACLQIIGEQARGGQRASAGPTAVGFPGQAGSIQTNSQSPGKRVRNGSQQRVRASEGPHRVGAVYGDLTYRGYEQLVVERWDGNRSSNFN